MYKRLFFYLCLQNLAARNCQTPSSIRIQLLFPLFVCFGNFGSARQCPVCPRTFKKVEAAVDFLCYSELGARNSKKSLLACFVGVNYDRMPPTQYVHKQSQAYNTQVHLKFVVCLCQGPLRILIFPGTRGVTFFGLHFYCIFGPIRKTVHLSNSQWI